MALDCCFTWLNERLETKRFSTACPRMSSSYRVLSKSKSQKIEPNVALIFLQGMGESDFVLPQFQINNTKPRRHEVLRFWYLFSHWMETQNSLNLTAELTRYLT